MRWAAFKDLLPLVREIAPSRNQMAFRLRSMERDVILPVKGVFLLLVFYNLIYTRWSEELTLPRSPAQVIVEQFFLIYLGFNLVVAGFLIFSRRMPSVLTQRVIFTSNFLDALFLAALTFTTGGFDSRLYWLFLALIVRNALSVSLATSQLALNFSVSMCYLAAGVLDVLDTDDTLDFEELAPTLNPTEPFLLRLLVLWLLTLLVFGVQVLLEKQRKAREEEETESHAREEHLHTTGRLAAQIAHQLKNPLAIINNAAFTLQRAVASGAPPRPEQVQIIRDEVDRADRIITELMDYTQLEAGRVEKLDFCGELDRAVAEVFPSGASFEVKVALDCGRGLPPLLMQSRHLTEILVNVLLNAREAVQGRGQIVVTAREGPDNAIEVWVQDDGPGIPPERVERIFEPYFTTKERGTGIGLAIVKQHVEMYGGTVRVESMLGKGARFILHLPTRSFTREHIHEQPPATPSPRR